MGSDRARISNDKRRDYRSVVSQQGRVTLEADQNEDRWIAGELLREETLDVVGPSGTPDDGFLVKSATLLNAVQNDVQIQAGTMFVGGERVVLESDLLYSAQPEWLDDTTDPAWVDPATVKQGENELVYLYLEEHEVSAVEDTALLEVALGGPDTAQRLRLVQRIRRFATHATTCLDATNELVQSLTALGLQRDPKTQRLTSNSTLKVVYQDPGTPDTLCEPGAQGGYLGAENQLIRIQTTGADDAGSPTLVWGYDNASFLYRVEVGADLQTLTLASSPVDDFHKPRSGQTVEVLRRAVQLETGTDTTVDLSDGDFVAAATGELFTLTADYDSTTKQVHLSSPLSGDFAPSVPPAPPEPPVFLRVWEAQIPFTPDQPTQLGATGVSVVLHTDVLPFHVGDYWEVAVRPKTPDQVYPKRYLLEGQPPDGPRLWLAPLAVIQWLQAGFTMVEDCRAHFDNLVDLSKRRESGCCDIVVHPEDLVRDTTLQTIVDRFKGKEATICLAPGTYALPEPLQLGKEHSGLTIEACHGPAVLQAAAGAESEFYDGLVVLVHANEVTLRGLHFRLPQVPLVRLRAAALKGTITWLRQAFASRFQRTNVSIGVRPLHCARLTIEECQFRFTLAEGQDVFAAGIFAGSECWGFTAHGNWFVHDEEYMHESGMARVLVGYLLSPSNIEEKAGAGRGGATRTGITGFIPTLLDDASFRDNHFSGLSAAALVYGDCGIVRIEDNTVRLCEFGFVFFSLRSWAYGVLAKDAAGTKALTGPAQMVLSSLFAITDDPVLALASLHARSYQVPSWLTKVPQLAVAKTAVKAADAMKPIKAVTNAAEKAFSAHPQEALSLVQPRAQTSVDLAKGEVAKFSPAGTKLAAAEAATIAARQRGPGLPFRLHFVENDLDLRGQSAQPGAALVEPGPSLVVWDADSETGSTLTMEGNRIATATPLAAVSIYLVERCAIAANVIENDFTLRPVSLLIVPLPPAKDGETVAVTGNAFGGRLNVPNRPHASPLDNWDIFNAYTL